MSLEHHISVSTVAMSVYNIIAFSGRPLAPEEIVSALGYHFDDIELEDIEAPLEQLARRGWLVAEEGKLEIVDADERRIIRTRADDHYYDDEGIPQGGWKGWTSQCPNREGKLLTEIAKEVAA